jgi:Acetyltransferases, including N-acetylases of ribosomal proteins
MFINNNTILLRAAEPDDAPCIYQWENDMTIWRVSETHTPYSHFQIEQFLLSNDLFSNRQLRLMIDLDKTKKSIGCIDIYDYDPINERAGIGILIDNRFRNQGYAEQSLELLLTYLFGTLLLKQAYCVIDEENLNCQHVFTKAGFIACGRRKQWLKTKNGFIDEIEFQLINENHK